MIGELDKNSVKYFMEEMTQEEFEVIRKSKPQSCHETGRYIFNKIRRENLESMDKVK